MHRVHAEMGAAMEFTIELKEVLEQYGYAESVLSVEPYGNGHINDTTLLVLQQPDERVILQRINTKIFACPEQLIENISRVTEWIATKVAAEGGDVTREVLHLIPTLSGGNFYKAGSGNYYRVYRFIEGGLCLEQPRSRDDFYESGIAFGKFQGYLADFAWEQLHITIPNFHNTRKRFEAFEKSVQSETGKVRGADAEDAIAYAFSKEPMITECDELKETQNIPLRVTHNDTKLNNVMLDAKTQQALCVLDLDTVMPGYAMDDFGDSIRFGANTAKEDEQDLSKVSFDLDLFRAYVEGFLKGTGGRLTEAEVKLLPLGAKMMTYECGIRFLADYLDGDIYFKIHYPTHNLVRARNQFALLKDMDNKTKEMNKIIKECLEYYHEE